MPIERETIIQTPTERETVVSGGGGPAGVIAGVVLFVLAILLAFWIFGAVFTDGGGTGSVSVDLPEVTVTE